MIELLRFEGESFVEVERWTFGRDELCYALEAPIWDRFGVFMGHPQITGEVLWLASDRSVTIDGRRGGRPFLERVR